MVRTLVVDTMYTDGAVKGFLVIDSDGEASFPPFQGKQLTQVLAETVLDYEREDDEPTISESIERNFAIR